MKIAINGFGRIGRNFLRAILQDPQAAEKLEVVAINTGPANKKNSVESEMNAVAHMFKYDTLMGTYPGSVKIEQDAYLGVGNYRIKLIAQADPAAIDWGALGVDWVVESSGHFTHAQDARKHIAAGAKHVLITAPAKGEDIAIIPGVNQELFDSKKHSIVSLGSCTTNALVPTLKVLHDAFGIVSGFMTTTHAYTNTQVLLDVNTDDLRRSRAAALNIIPTTTGASDMVGKIIPELDGVVLSTSIRVPVAKVSLIDLSLITQKPCSVESIHAAFESAAQGPMRGILALTHDPLVSSDFSGDNHSVTIDGLMTAVNSKNGNFAKVFGWYDNEWGYSVRLKDFLMIAAR